MHHLYFLVRDPDLSREIVERLKAIGVPEEDIGLVARDNIDLEDLPEADIAETSDIKPAVKRGIAAGGATGLLAGIAVNVIPGGLVLGGLALAAATLAGGAFGAWISTLIGISVPNSEIDRFDQEIANGSVLLIIKPVAVERERIREAIVEHYPEVEFGGEEHTVPRLT